MSWCQCAAWWWVCRDGCVRTCVSEPTTSSWQKKHVVADPRLPSLSLPLSLLCIHPIYSLSFQSIFNDFAVPVCLLLLIVVVLYFICLYLVYPVKHFNFNFYTIVSPVFTYSTVQQGLVVRQVYMNLNYSPWKIKFSSSSYLALSEYFH